MRSFSLIAFLRSRIDGARGAVTRAVLLVGFSSARNFKLIACFLANAAVDAPDATRGYCTRGQTRYKIKYTQ